MLQALINKGLKAHQAGNLDVAKHCYKEVLSAYPNEPNANQLLGLIYSSEAQLDQAITLMRRSLEVNPNQPAVLNNLGNCYKRNGQQNTAINLYNKSLKLQPNYYDAAKNLALTYLDINRPELAREIIDTYAQYSNLDTKLENILGKVCLAEERYLEAVTRFKELALHAPHDFTIRHNLALSLRLSGKPQDALIHYKWLADQGFEDANFLHNYANNLTDLGMVNDAVLYYEKALEKQPGYVYTHKNLNNLYWELGEQTSFLSSFTRTFNTQYDSAELKLVYCDFLMRLQQYEQVEAFCKQHKGELRNQAHYYDVLGRVCSKQRRVDEAVRYHIQAVEMDEDNTDFINNLAKTLIEAGRFEEAEKYLISFLDGNEDDQLAIAHLGVCWRRQGKYDQYLRIHEYDNFVRPYQIAIPEGYSSIKDFCLELCDFLRTQHTTEHQPLEQTLHHGSQTQANLFDNQHPLIVKFVKQIEIALSQYKNDCKFTPKGELGLPYCKDHFFSGSWSVRLKSNGYHNNHVHPMGWLSACFYVELPNVVDSSEDNSGWIKFGEPQLNLLEPLLPEKFVKPKVGTVVFFPSYMWHGTVPFSSEEERITIAFDVANSD